jgi:hypothetical protein
MKLFTNNYNVQSDITDVWNISKQDLQNINQKMISIEHTLHKQHKGHYFDYQLVDNFFNELSDFEKAMIFVYGQMVHEHIYKKNL